MTVEARMSGKKTDANDDQDAVAMADTMLKRPVNRTVSPSGDAVEAAAGPSPGVALDGQLGPDELPEPEEVILNNEAKLAH
jgi:hypothetical protein